MNTQTIALNGLIIYLKNDIVICVRDTNNGQFVKCSLGVQAIEQSKQVKKALFKAKIEHCFNVCGMYLMLGFIFGLFLLFTVAPIQQDTNDIARMIMQGALVGMYVILTSVLHKDMYSDLKHSLKRLKHFTQSNQCTV